MAQFGRQYNLQVFNADNTKVLDTDRLRIAFDINKTLASTPNKGIVTVYGLAKNTRNNLRGSFNRVLLSAGYPDNTDVIFDGQTKKMDVIKEAGNIKTVFTAGDGAKGLKYGSVSVTIDGGTPLVAVIRTLADSLAEVKAGALNGLEGKRLTETGMSFTGTTKIVMDALGASYDFSWSIQDGVLETVASKKESPGSTIGEVGATAYVISARTGMIGIPVVKDSGQVSVNALLNPRIKPGRVVKIETIAAAGSGFYKVSAVNFKGDSHGKNWTISLAGVPIYQ